jgi:hypothetical protein
MKQWAALVGTFHVIVFDAGGLTLRMIGPESKLHVVDVLCGSLRTEAMLTTTGELILDAERLMPPSMLCKFLQPCVFLHFAESEPGQLVVGPVPAPLRPLSALCAVYDAYALMLATPPAHLRWSVAPPSPPSFLSNTARAISTLCRGAPQACDDAAEPALALALIVWVLLLFGPRTRRVGGPEQRCKVSLTSMPLWETSSAVPL